MQQFKCHGASINIKNLIHGPSATGRYTKRKRGERPTARKARYTHLRTIKNVLTPCRLEQTNEREIDGKTEEAAAKNHPVQRRRQDFKPVDISVPRWIQTYVCERMYVHMVVEIGFVSMTQYTQIYEISRKKNGPRYLHDSYEIEETCI